MANRNFQRGIFVVQKGEEGGAVVDHQHIDFAAKLGEEAPCSDLVESVADDV